MGAKPGKAPTSLAQPVVARTSPGISEARERYSPHAMRKKWERNAMGKKMAFDGHVEFSHYTFACPKLLVHLLGMETVQRLDGSIL